LNLDEVEPNDVLNQANFLPAGLHAKGILTHPGDKNDWWKFTLSQSSEVDVWWHITGGEIASYDYLCLRDGAGNEIAKDSSDDQGYFQVTVYLPAGTYYIQLYKDGPSGFAVGGRIR